MIGAQTPIVAAVGSRPTNSEDRPISRIVIMSTHLRPNRSPMTPKNSPPIGRAMKPTA